MAQQGRTFSVERRVGATWRVIHEVADDQAAAHLAQALVRQDPTEAVRICAPAGATKSGQPNHKVLWQHDGLPAQTVGQADRLAVDSIDPASLSRQAGVRSRSRLSRPDGAAPDRRAPRPATADRPESRRKVYLPIFFIGLLMVLATLGLSQLGLIGWLGMTPSPPPAQRPTADERPAPEKPNKFGRLVINLTQAAVARRYAYQSCIAENLRLGLVIVRRSYENQRISRTMLSYYESQLGEVLDDLNKGRDKLLRAPAEKGGLPHDLVRFIDDWFRLERDMLQAKQRLEEIVNPETYCRAAAERADYLAAYYETKKR